LDQEQQGPAGSKPPTFADLLAVIAGQQAQIVAQQAQIEALQAQILALKTENAALKARVAELERQLGLNSSNSGKPPSSDGLKKPARVTSLREKTGRKTGGQPGHKGSTLRQTYAPDVVVDHLPPACADCGGALSAADSVDMTRRQVFDIPEPQPLLATEHRAHGCRCPACGATTRAEFPDGVAAPVQYGPNIAAVAAYLSAGHFISEERIAQLLSDLFKADISAASVGALVRRKAAELTGFAAAVGEEARNAAVKHADETGIRVGAALHWLQALATTLLTFYIATLTRGEIIVCTTGTVVHDHFKSYFRLEGIRHALCGQHHLRELKALVEIEKEPWAKDMARILRMACHAANLARRGDMAVRPWFLAVFTSRYRRIVAEALAFHEAQPPLELPGRKKRGRPKRRTGHNLAIRLRDYEEAALRFLHDPTVPFTNNVGELAMRMAKVKMKVSGCFRTMAGAHDFAILRGSIDTARKQGWRIFETLKAPSEILVARLRTG
jgi:transposase